MTKTVTIYCKNNGTYKDYPLGTSLLDIYKDMGIKLNSPVLAAKVNYKVESLNFLIYKPKNIEFIDVSHPSGYRVYVRSMSMILSKAVHDVLPETVLRIEFPINNGYYCCINNRDTDVSEELVGKIKKRMQDIIEEDMVIDSIEQQTHSVVELFKKDGKIDNAILLQTLGIPYARYFKIGDFIDYYNGILVPSTGYTKAFDLIKYNNGFVLMLPERFHPKDLAKFVNQPKMFDVFDEFARWNKLMGMNNVGNFNLMSEDSDKPNLINISEALHEKKIAQIADMVKEREDAKFIMISGPSSSGKTSFAKRLCVQLIVSGLKPILLSLDNYFVNREDTPLDENGEWDFEHITAIDLPLLNDHLQRMMAGEKVEVPHFNFKDGKRYYHGDMVQINPGNILVMEGIHALNPELTPSIPESAKFKIYVSALTTISLDNHNWISTTDTRLLRRIVRDYKFRNFSARETISRWPSVIRGERKWIFPYQENADVMFNSALLFEFAVLRKHAEPILADVPQWCDEYTDAHRMIKFLKYFNPILEQEIPATSLLREFLGGSSLK